MSAPVADVPHPTRELVGLAERDLIRDRLAFFAGVWLAASALWLLLDLGLEDSLRSLAGGMSTATTRVVASFPTAIPRLDDEVEVAVYRVAQEAISNALRHAAASEIGVSLTVADRVLRLEARDDGCGFDPEVRRREALGLISMEERALALDGRIEVGSEAGRGTLIRLICPVVRVQPRTAA